MTRPLLALIAHSSDGFEKNALGSSLERGVHLRWEFRHELGFPLGGFCVFRREARIPKMLCGWIDKLEFGKGVKEAQVTIDGSTVVIKSETPIKHQKERVSWILSDEYSKLGNPPPKNSRIITTVGSEQTLRIEIPLTPFVSIDVLADLATRITAKAYSGGRMVAQKIVVCNGKAKPILLSSDRIDAIVIRGKNPRIARVCIAQEEPCRYDDYRGCFDRQTEDCPGEKEWKRVSNCPICLPVSHPDYPCHCGDGCSEETAQDRLPKDRCARAKYDGENLRELLDTLRVVVDHSRGPTMGSRFMPVRAEVDDCPPPESRSAGIQMSAMDMLLTASVDPVIAQILGLYLVDGSAEIGHRYDYKIVGYWPKGTLWSLDHVIGFNDEELSLPSGFKHERLTFVADSFCHIVKVSRNFAGVTYALQLQADTFNWRPILPPPASSNDRRIYVSFEQPVGEVQIYARQVGGGITLNAYHNGILVDSTQTNNYDALLAVHAPEIDKIEIRGDIQYLYQIHYGMDYLPHGTYCYVLYGVEVGTPDALEAPSGVTGTALPGVTRKQNDCEPLLSGQIADTRYPVGVRWTSPVPADKTILSKEPLLFHIERMFPDGSTESCTKDSPRMVTDSAENPSVPASPIRRSFFTDVVPYPGSYKYQVSGIDIFGRQSGFGSWSDTVLVKAMPPPAPASVQAKWLDPKDSTLTDSERSWIADGLPGALIRWEWLDSQDRQSPFIEKFHIAFEHGWLNHIIGTVKSNPSASGNEIIVDVEFERKLKENVLAGMMMHHRGVPFRILKNSEASIPSRYLATLTCVPPRSGVPCDLVGETVAIPLNVSVRAMVEEVEAPFNIVKSITLLVRDLRVEPVAGFAGAVLSVGGQEWSLSNVTVLGSSPEGLVIRGQLAVENKPSDVARAKSLYQKTMTLQLPSPMPPFVDYRLLSNWPIKIEPTIPTAGIGLYEVFVRTAKPGETLGRTTISMRCHRILCREKLLSPSGLEYGQVAVASEAQSAIGVASSPATLVRPVRETPQQTITLTSADDLVPIYASPPDYYGHSSYAYQWNCTSNARYIVYRVLDETLFSIDRRVGPLRAKARSEWDAFLNQFPDPDQTLQDKAFDTFIVRQAEPEYQNLSNRLLQILASFPDVEETFTRLNGEPIDSAQGSQCIYRDNSLPAEGHNRYFYRAKAIDVYGNAAQMSVSTPPIYLRPGRPQAPVITRVTGGDRKIMLTWVSNQDPNLLEYYVYRADNADATSDIGLMKKIGTVLVDPNPAARPVVVEWIDPPQSSGTALPGLKDFWYSVVAVNRVDPLDPLGRGRNVSEPSIVMRGRTFDESLPLVPTLTVTWNATTPPTNALISWISNDQTRLERRGLDMPIWDSIGDWRPPGAYNLIIPMDASYSWQFRLRVKKETNALSIGTATSLPHV